MPLPQIDITFEQLAATAIQRSAKGIVGLIVKDDTDTTFSQVEYKDATEIETAKFTATNVQYIKDCFIGVPSKVIVLRIDATTPVLADALTLANSLKVNWIGIAEATTQDTTDLVVWVKARETENKTFKAVVFNATAPDSKQIVNFVNSNITFADARAEQTGEKYIASLLGIFAGLPLDRSATYFTCSNLLSVVEPADVNATIDAGGLVLINDDNVVKIGSAVTSLQTITTNNTIDMKQIATVEVINIILDDIRTAFKDDYIGKYKNKLDNQMLFISAVNTFFRGLTEEDALDENYNNVANINVEAQRQAWIDAGKPEAATWTEQQVKNTAYRNTIFLIGDIKILGAIENLNFKITIF